MVATLLLDRGAETVTYLDPDICVYGSVQHIADLATKHGVVLTPHLLTPLPRDGLQPGEAQIMGAGAFNLGFVAVSQAARPFLRWWQERLERDAINDQSRSLFTDQRWVDLVPSLFPHHVLRDPGCNVAYWNAHSRPIARAADSWTAGGEPLRFFHFSGYRPHTPWLLSRHAPDYPRVRLPDHPALRTLCDEYGEALRSYGAAVLHGDDYGWGRLPDGEPITPGQRRCYRQALLAADRGAAPYPPDPFGEAGPAAYLDWLHAPAGTDSRVSRFVHAAWSSRPDLQAAFPDPLGRSEDHLLAWLQDEGCEQLGIPLDRRPRADPRRVLPAPAAPEVMGVNVIGYLKAELGVGQIGRFAVAASRAAALAVTTLGYNRTVSRQQHPFVVSPFVSILKSEPWIVSLVAEAPALLTAFGDTLVAAVGSPGAATANPDTHQRAHAEQAGRRRQGCQALGHASAGHRSPACLGSGCFYEQNAPARASPSTHLKIFFDASEPGRLGVSTSRSHGATEPALPVDVSGIVGGPTGCTAAPSSSPPSSDGGLGGGSSPTLSTQELVNLATVSASLPEAASGHLEPHDRPARPRDVAPDDIRPGPGAGAQPARTAHRQRRKPAGRTDQPGSARPEWSGCTCLARMAVTAASGCPVPVMPAHRASQQISSA